MKTVIIQAFTENINGTNKGSMNRVIAFFIALVICFIGIYCTITGKTIPDSFILEITGFASVLLGFTMASKNTDIKASNTPTPTVTN